MDHDWREREREREKLQGCTTRKPQVSRAFKRYLRNSLHKKFQPIKQPYILMHQWIFFQSLIKKSLLLISFSIYPIKKPLPLSSRGTLTFCEVNPPSILARHLYLEKESSALEQFLDEEFVILAFGTPGVRKANAVKRTPHGHFQDQVSCKEKEDQLRD